MLWQLEIGNVLLQAERRGRVTTADVGTRLELIGALPIVTDDETWFGLCTMCWHWRGPKT